MDTDIDMEMDRNTEIWRHTLGWLWLRVRVRLSVLLLEGCWFDSPPDVDRHGHENTDLDTVNTLNTSSPLLPRVFL